MELHKVSPAFRHSDDIETIQRLQVKNRVLVKEISALKKHIENIITEKDNCAIEWVKCRERERELNHVVDHMVRESGKQIERERVLTKAIDNIAIQKLETEMDEEDREGADYQTGYECIVKVARAALAAKEE